MPNYRTIAGKVWSAITHAVTAVSVFTLVPWPSAFTVVVALISAGWATVIAVWAAAIGSIPVWAIPMLVLIITFAITGSMLLLVRKKVVYVASQYKQLEHDNQDLHQALKDATGEVNAATLDRDTALKALKVCREKFACNTLTWISNRALQRGIGNINVVVRIATPDDHFLAQKITQIFQRNMQWPVTLDGSNNPAIEPNNDCKVLFESDFSGIFDEIAKAFKSGNLLDNVSVGVHRKDLLEDKRRLVVEVTPTVLGVKETISQT